MKQQVLAWVLFLNLGSAHAIESQCPQTAESWEKWRLEKISKLEQPFDLSSEDFKILDNCSKDPNQQNKFFTDPKFLKCMNPLWNSVRAFGQNAFMNIPETEYYNSSRLDFPELLDLPSPLHEQKLLNFKYQMGAPNEFEQTLREALSGYPGAQIVKSSSLYLMTIPGKDYDLWVNSLDRQGYLSIGIQKRDRQNHILPTPKAFYNLHHIERTNDGTLQLVRVSQKGPLSCQQCHAVGGLILHPFQDLSMYSPVMPEKSALENIVRMREIMTSTANVEMDSISIPDFPILGSINPPQRTQEFMTDCSNSIGKSFTPVRIDAIKKSMNCAQCHNGTTAAPIRPITHDGVIKAAILGGHMPPGADKPNSSKFLQADEREALYQCLVRWEYYGGFPKLSPPQLQGGMLNYLKNTENCSE